MEATEERELRETGGKTERAAGGEGGSGPLLGAPAPEWQDPHASGVLAVFQAPPFPFSPLAAGTFPTPTPKGRVLRLPVYLAT